MENFIDPFLSSDSWPDLSISSRTSWEDTVASQVEANGESAINKPVCMIQANDFDPNSNENHNYVAQHESNSTSESYGQEFNSSCSVTLPHGAFTISSSIESNGSEPTKYSSIGDVHSISSVQSMWSQSYPNVFGTQMVGNEYFINNEDYLHMNNASTDVHDCNGLQSKNLSNFNGGQQMKLLNGTLHLHNQEQNGMKHFQIPSFSMGPESALNNSPAFHAYQQLPRPIEGNILQHQADDSAQANNTNASNGSAKPRVRARRGQATDPHSIAERLRREKIAERMKNLQELVPNSNKADKASMLDEIIEYVKFLQLQVKVLSMSRLGATGAVVPLITDTYVEGSGNFHPSSVSHSGSPDLSDAEESIAFEQEVIKLMESNVTAAMQFLQNKGLCLMPTALASAISHQKGSDASTIPDNIVKQEESIRPRLS